MNREQILNSVRTLAHCQGYYSGLYNFLTSSTDEAENLLMRMEEQNFSDAVDMVMWLEN